MAARTILFVVLLLTGCSGSEPPFYETKAALGEALFADTQLSAAGTQACATCHDPSHGFVDPRLGPNDLRAVSLGDDGVSLGDRNAPTILYAAQAPPHHVGRRERLNSQSSAYEGHLGGQFWDGRALDLPNQAAAPPLNPLEMAMPSEAAVVARLADNPDYVSSFEGLFGEDVLASDADAYRAMTEAIAEFERGDALSPFASKYDRFLADPLGSPLSLKEALGKSLFFSQTDTNCATCHQLKLNSNKAETFTSGEFHNIGVPVNEQARAANGLGAEHIDHGLMDVTGDPADDGKFKVPTLRNIAVTGPYMHNGVFADLRTVLLFYDQYFMATTHPLNPETGEPWRDPEVVATVNLDELITGGALDDDRIDSLVCFLRTLTDERYESLVPDDGIDCAD